MIPTTPAGMLREVLGTIVDTCMKMSEAAMGMNVADVETRFDVLARSMKIMGVIEREIEGKDIAVVHCAKCAHCMSLERVDPMRPYTGPVQGADATLTVFDGFYCKKWDNDFFAPDYRAETWFCADGIPRENGGDGMK